MPKYPFIETITLSSYSRITKWYGEYVCHKEHNQTYILSDLCKYDNDSWWFIIYYRGTLPTELPMAFLSHEKQQIRMQRKGGK